jgi:hypothetical protein
MSSTVYRLDHRGIPVKRAVLPLAHELHTAPRPPPSYEWSGGPMESMGRMPIVLAPHHHHLHRQREQQEEEYGEGAEAEGAGIGGDGEGRVGGGGEASVAMDFAVMTGTKQLVIDVKSRKAPRMNAEIARAKAGAAVPYPTYSSPRGGGAVQAEFDLPSGV